jgi:hypothetical protein
MELEEDGVVLLRNCFLKGPVNKASKLKTSCPVQDRYKRKSGGWNSIRAGVEGT